MQPLDNAIFAVLKAHLDRLIEELNIQNDSTRAGKIAFLKCLFEARQSVTPKVVKHGFQITGNWPISRAKAHLHPEVQPDEPEKSTPHDPTAQANQIDSDDEAVDRSYIMSLATSTTTRYKAKRIADKVADQDARIAFLEARLATLEAKEQSRNKTKKRKAAPPPYGKVFSSASELLAKGYTIESLDPNTGGEKPPRAPKRAKKAPVVVVEVEDDEGSVAATSKDSEAEEAEVQPARRTRTRGKISKPARYVE